MIIVNETPPQEVRLLWRIHSYLSLQNCNLKCAQADQTHESAWLVPASDISTAAVIKIYKPKTRWENLFYCIERSKGKQIGKERNV